MSTRTLHHFVVPEYDLAATLDCGQAFRWKRLKDGWHGVVDGKWIRLSQHLDGIEAETSSPQADWRWLAHYLQTEIDFAEIVASFPADPHLQAAAKAHRGLRLLRQPPWECLASFILSSTKQIIQIRQIIDLLCERFGEPVNSPRGTNWHSFPSAARLVEVSEADLRACKMGFRAPHLHAAARMVASGQLDLEQVGKLSHEEARNRLMNLNGVGEKIAECVALFAYGYEDAFPVDVWVARALRQFYFRGRNIPLRRLQTFAAKRWRRCGGYAQQYLFHYIRNQPGKTSRPIPPTLSCLHANQR